MCIKCWAMKFCSCNLFRVWRGYSSRHQKSICDGGIRLSRYFRYYVTFSFLVFHVFLATRSNLQPLRSGLKESCRLAPSKKTAAAPSFRRMSWNWIGGFSQKEEQMASERTKMRKNEDISAKRPRLSSFRP